MHRGVIVGMGASAFAVVGGLASIVEGGYLAGILATTGGLAAAAASSILGGEALRAERAADLVRARAHEAEAQLAAERSGANTDVAAPRPMAPGTLNDVGVAAGTGDPSEAPHSLLDAATGLPDARFFALHLESRIAGAKRHLWPVSVLLFAIADELEHEGDGITPLAAASGAADAPLDRLLATVDDPFLSAAQVVRDTVRDADSACRLPGQVLALVLDDTPEAGAVWVAERAQIALGRIGFDLRLVSVGVACYPTHGLTAAEVGDAANDALAVARATVPPAAMGTIQVAAVPVEP